MSPGAGVLMLGRGHISYIVNMYYLLHVLYQYTAHWLLLCLGIMMLLSYTNNTMVDFHLFYDGAVDIQIWALLTRIQCKVSDTQVTFKAGGPLVLNFVVKIALPQKLQNFTDINCVKRSFIVCTLLRSKF